MRLGHLWSLAGIVITLLAAVPGVRAQTVGFHRSPLVDHPVHHPMEVRSAHRWRSSVGSWGESFAEQTLRMRGFNEIHEIKTGGNNGIDRVAVKRGADGAIKEVKYVEVKANRSSKPTLNRTKLSGQQMSRKHLADNLRKMRNSGDPSLRKLALEMSRFRRSSGVPVHKMGEVIHISTKTGRVTTYSGDLKSVKSVESAERLLKQIQRRGSSSEVRRWAARSLARWDQIGAERMSSYLGKSAAQQSERTILLSSARGVIAAEVAVENQAQRVLARKILQRVAGPIAFVASFAFDAKELYDTEYAYRTGAISERQRNIRILTTLGGAAGAFAGASSFGAAGAWLGAFGGPFAWITVPAGGFLGATIGGIGGYFGGSSIAKYGATAWYSSIDGAVRERLEIVLLSSRPPID